MATPQEKAAAAQAWAGKQTKALNAEFTAVWMDSNFKPNTAKAVAFVNKVKKTDPAGAAVLTVFFADGAAQKALLNKVAPIKTPGENLGDIVDAAVPGAPWQGVMQTVYNMGIQAAVLAGAAALLILGVVILLRAPLAKATPLGKVAKVVGK